MQEQEVINLVSRAAALMEQYERASTGIQQQLQSLAQDLQDVTRQLPANAEQSAEGLLRSVPTQVMSQVQKGLDQSVSNTQQRLAGLAGEATHSTQELAHQIQYFQQLTRMLMWKIVGVTVVSLGLLLVGGIWLANHYYTIIQSNQIEASLLQAYNRADVTLCDGQLCANVDPKGQRFGDKKQYLAVRPR